MHSPARAAGASSCRPPSLPRRPTAPPVPSRRRKTFYRRPGRRNSEEDLGWRAGWRRGQAPPSEPGQRRAGEFSKGLRLSVLPFEGDGQPAPPFSGTALAIAGFPSLWPALVLTPQVLPQRSRVLGPSRRHYPSGRVEGNRAKERGGQGRSCAGAVRRLAGRARAPA